jgi:uncharacterized protein DUF3291
MRYDSHLDRKAQPTVVDARDASNDSRADAGDGWELAQVNIALPREPLDSELLSDFVAALDPVNAAADAAPGFVWRLQTEEGDSTEVRGFGDDRIIINMTVWESIEALRAFVYTDASHRSVLRRRKEWFESLAEAHYVLWWVPAGHRPTIAEAEQRLDLLRAQGPTPDAFTLRETFSPARRLGGRTATPRRSDAIRVDELQTRTGSSPASSILRRPSDRSACTTGGRP